jgi:hypothetical protein
MTKYLLIKVLAFSVLLVLSSCNELVSYKAPPEDDNTPSKEEVCNDCDKGLTRLDKVVCNSDVEKIWLSGQCDFVTMHEDQVPEMEVNTAMTYEKELILKKTYLMSLLRLIENRHKKRSIKKLVVESYGENRLEDDKLVLNLNDMISNEDLSILLRLK